MLQVGSWLLDFGFFPCSLRHVADAYFCARFRARANSGGDEHSAFHGRGGDS